METNFAILIAISSIILIILLILFCFFVIFHKDHFLKLRIFSFVLNIRKKSRTQTNLERQKIKDSLLESLTYFSKKKIGSIIVIEKDVSLNNFKDTGFKVESDISSEFIISIFSNKNVSFHDGALIITKNKISSISCYLPISKSILDIKYGARHRSAVGITEITDAVVFVSSETNGDISCAFNGKLFNHEKDWAKIKSSIERLI
ncbi:MAG: DNA integrity scanning protein DisA nucleotide-binding domain protein [Malacoplasma sp.]